ncbi:hypothetical protein BsWGS_15412 [Bradybaena similaris]
MYWWKFSVVYLCTLTYRSLLVTDRAASKNAVAGVSSVRYACSECSLPTSPTALPLIQKTRSRLKCATACSRREWCSSYAIRNDTEYTGTASNLTAYECALYVDEGYPCLMNSASTLGIRTCVKVTNGSKCNPIPCAATPLTVLEVNATYSSLTIDLVYLRNLLTVGNDLMVQYDNGTIKYAALANYVTLGNGSSEICCSIIDSNEQSNTTAALLFLREFCTTSLLQDSIPGPAFSWKLQQKEYTGDINVVFATGGSTSSLEAALTNGSEIKLMVKGNNSVVRAEIISQSEDKGNQIVAQTTLFDSGNYKIVSYYTSQQQNTVLLDLSLGTLRNPNTQKADVLWLADPCWTHVYTTDPRTHSQGRSLPALLDSINEGRRIRVKFKIEKLVILATPDLVGLDEHNTVIVHVLRVMSQEPFLGKLVKLPSLNDQSQWAHYYITSNGIISLIRASQVSPVTQKATVDWFVEFQSYSLTYTSSSRNMTSLARLVSRVLEGKNVRVRVHNGTNRIFYTCHMVQVIQNGQEVKCQINGQLGVELLGPKLTRSINLSSILPPNLSALVGLTTTTGCFQSVAVLAFQGSTDYFLSCPGTSNSSQVRIKQPQEVDWFVAD